MVEFGIKTVPAQIGYDELAAVWHEADAVEVIRDAWLWDHLLPLMGPKGGPIFEGWTLLAALAAQTGRLRMGLLVTSNRLRPPAMLAKIAATVDAISHGRLVVGLGVGGTHQDGENPALAEYAAYGFDLVPPAEGIARLDETCRILRRLWTEEVVDFDGKYYRLRENYCSPKPVQHPGPPLLLGGWGDRTLRVVAEHADIWNIPGPPHNDTALIAERGRVLDEHCRAIGRDPREITWSVQTHAFPDDVERTRRTVLELADIGVGHVVLNLLKPFRPGLATWAAEEIIQPIQAKLA
ncbi:LLM class flavin-dependent oxidoreductase [Kribbella koreensis]|uniref:LLM class flavin-dependent oxidoreductase n=1 Tax=Kribbella koreensis TaxID=57909 RepID=A0ABN1R4R0_9ACTN